MREVTIVQMNGRVEDVSPILNLPDLREFAIHEGEFVSDLGFVEHLPRMRVLGLPGLDGVGDFSPLASQPGLRKLFLYDCGKLDDIEILRSLTALRG